MTTPTYSKEIITKLISVWTTANELNLVHGNRAHLGFGNDIFFLAGQNVFCSHTNINASSAFGQMKPVVYDFTEQDVLELVTALEHKIEAAIVESKLAYKAMLSGMRVAYPDQMNAIEDFYSNPLAKKLFSPINSGGLRMNQRAMAIIGSVERSQYNNGRMFSNGTNDAFINISNMTFQGDYVEAIKMLKVLLSVAAWEHLMMVLDKPHAEAFFEYQPHERGFVNMEPSAFGQRRS